MSTILFMKAMSSCYLNLGNIQNPRAWTFLVGFNVNFITMAGEFFMSFFNFILYLMDTLLSLHAGVSTMDTETQHTIPFSAFINAVKQYKADSETDGEGSMRIS